MRYAESLKLAEKVDIEVLVLQSVIETAERNGLKDDYDFGFYKGHLDALNSLGLISEDVYSDFKTRLEKAHFADHGTGTMD